MDITRVEVARTAVIRLTRMMHQSDVPGMYDQIRLEQNVQIFIKRTSQIAFTGSLGPTQT